MELTRKQIKDQLPPDVSFSLRKIGFSDLARGEAVVLTVKRNGEPMPSMFFGEWHRQKWLDVIEAEKNIKGNHYQGRRII